MEALQGVRQLLQNANRKPSQTRWPLRRSRPYSPKARQRAGGRRQILVGNSGLSTQGGSCWRLMCGRKAERYLPRHQGRHWVQTERLREISFHCHCCIFFPLWVLVKHFEDRIGIFPSAELGPWAWERFWISPCDSVLMPACRFLSNSLLALALLPDFGASESLSFLLSWPAHSGHYVDLEEILKYFRGTCFMCFLGICSTEMSTKLVIASLFITCPNCKPPNAHPQQNRINKSWHVHTSK